MQVDIIWWVAFNVFVLAMLALDLGVVHRKSHEIGIKEALIWSTIWTVLALIFNGWMYYWAGKDVGLAFLTGYLIERSLSIDNIFVFYLVFSYFAVPKAYQHKVLFWGILGALAMRAVFIAVGITLINKFYWVIYIFGVFLIVTGIRMAITKEQEMHPERNPVLVLFRRWFPTTENYEEDRFFVSRNSRRLATPLFIVLLIVETTDLLFAVDSIPAILAITTDPFIVYTSNVFAILGLRALYFALAGITEMFYYIHYGLAVILVFIGIKMLLEHVYEISIVASLVFIASVLIISGLASVVRAKREHLP
ncbi:MAG: TerC family protein [Armatimonadota bacterium]|nr:TerC family protein [bacterium]